MTLQTTSGGLHSQKRTQTTSDNILPSGLSSPEAAEVLPFLQQSQYDVIICKKKFIICWKKKKGERNKKRQGKAKKECEYRSYSSASASLFVLGKLVLSNKVSLY